MTNYNKPTIYNMSQRLKILVVSANVPHPDIHSGDRRLAALLRILASKHQVDFLAVSGSDPRFIDNRYIDGLKRIRVNILPDTASPRWCIRRAFGFGEEEYGGFPVALTLVRYDIVIFETYSIAENRIEDVRGLQPFAAVVVDSVDIHYVRERAGAALGLGKQGQDADKTRQRELAVYRRSDAVIVVTSEDYALVEAEGQMPRRLHIPNIVPIRPRPVLRREPDVLFVGFFGHSPNIDGIVWFTNEVWGLIRERVPDARLLIVGSQVTEEIRALGGRAGVEVVGYVRDTGPYLDRAAVSIAPLRFGAGMKGKVTEALASGVPTVSTTFGAQGFAAVPGRHLLVADSAMEFADAVVRFLNDPLWAESIGASAQDLVARVCTEDSVANRLLEGIWDIASDNHPSLPSGIWLAHALFYRAWGSIFGRPLIFVIRALKAFPPARKIFWFFRY